MPPISGVIFEAARPGDELSQIEARASSPDFWNNQIEAQKTLQRRRRVEEEVELIAALKTKADDLGVLFEWAGQGEDVARSWPQGSSSLPPWSKAAKSRRCSAASTIARTPS